MARYLMLLRHGPDDFKDLDEAGFAEMMQKFTTWTDALQEKKALVAVEPIAGEVLSLEVVVAALYPPEPSLADRLAAIASEIAKEPVKVQLVGLQTRWVSSGSASDSQR